MWGCDRTRTAVRVRGERATCHRSAPGLCCRASAAGPLVGSAPLSSEALQRRHTDKTSTHTYTCALPLPISLSLPPLSLSLPPSLSPLSPSLSRSLTHTHTHTPHTHAHTHTHTHTRSHHT